MRNRHKAYKSSILCYIFENRLEPGMRLPSISELADILDLSIRSVQEGVRQLKEDGYIEVKVNQGMYVKDLRPSMVYQGGRMGLVTSGGRDYLADKPYPSEVIEALSKKVVRDGGQVEICTLDDFRRGSTTNTKAIGEIEDRRFDGLFLFECDSDSLILDLRNLGIPMVSMDIDTSHLGAPSVVFDNTYGTMAMTEHLIRLGHCHIAYFQPRSLVRMGATGLGTNAHLDEVHHLRFEGYRMAMLRAELDDHVEEFPGPKLLRKRLQRCFDRKHPVSAIVTGSDWHADTVARAVLEMGLSIPDDVSLSGFGDTGKEYSPGQRISTVHVDNRAMGREAARLMKRIFDGKIEHTERVLIPATVAEYDSTAAPKPRFQAPGRRGR